MREEKMKDGSTVLLVHRAEEPVASVARALERLSVGVVRAQSCADALRIVAPPFTELEIRHVLRCAIENTCKRRVV
jgi:hypothetical protein